MIIRDVVIWERESSKVSVPSLCVLKGHTLPFTICSLPSVVTAVPVTHPRMRKVPFALHHCTLMDSPDCVRALRQRFSRLDHTARSGILHEDGYIRFLGELQSTECGLNSSKTPIELLYLKLLEVLNIFLPFIWDCQVLLRTTLQRGTSCLQWHNLAQRFRRWSSPHLLSFLTTNSQGGNEHRRKPPVLRESPTCWPNLCLGNRPSLRFLFSVAEEDNALWGVWRHWHTVYTSIRNSDSQDQFNILMFGLWVVSGKL